MFRQLIYDLSIIELFVALTSVDRAIMELYCQRDVIDEAKPSKRET